MTEIIIHFDGSCGPENPGYKGRYGFTIEFPEQKLEMSGDASIGSLISNNYAEFLALHKSLEALFKELHLRVVDSEHTTLTIKGDSMFVINMLTKRWRADWTKIYYPAYVLAKESLNKAKKLGFPVNLVWIPREENTNADALTR
jgi:ribonuclease HI